MALMMASTTHTFFRLGNKGNGDNEIVRLFCAHGPRWCLELELEPRLEPKGTCWCLKVPTGSIVNLEKGRPAAY